MSGRLHEDYGREELPTPGSDRSFGFVMAVAIPLIIAIFFREHWEMGVGIGAGFALLGLVAPRVLNPLNQLWFRFGILLGRIVAPIVMGIIFFLVVTPIALIRRALGKHSLATRFDPDAETYWVEREPPGPDPEHLPRQF